MQAKFRRFQGFLVAWLYERKNPTFYNYQKPKKERQSSLDSWFLIQHAFEPTINDPSKVRNMIWKWVYLQFMGQNLVTALMLVRRYCYFCLLFFSVLIFLVPFPSISLSPSASIRVACQFHPLCLSHCVSWQGWKSIYRWTFRVVRAVIWSIEG